MRPKQNHCYGHTPQIQKGAKTFNSGVERNAIRYIATHVNFIIFSLTSLCLSVSVSLCLCLSLSLFLFLSLSLSLSLPLSLSLTYTRAHALAHTHTHTKQNKITAMATLLKYKKGLKRPTLA